MTPQNAPASKSTNPIVWILAAIAAIVVLLGVAAVVTGLFVAKKARDAGIDADLFRRNPGVAITRMITALNADAEIVSVDEARGTVIVRDKRNGKTVTLRFDDVKKGHIVIDTDGKESVTINSDAPVKLPLWVPQYPGAAAKANVRVETEERDVANVTMTTPDDVRKVLDYYEREFRKQGRAWKLNLTHNDSGGVIHATDEGNERIVTIVAASDGSETTINLSFSRK
ncbi:MAG: hypothetical protein ABI693_00630 [Bryobacteraceae bacterium]